MLGTRHAGVSSRAKPSRQLYKMDLLCNLERHSGRALLPSAPPQCKQNIPEAAVTDRSRWCFLHHSRTDLRNLLSTENKKLAEELHKHFPVPRVMAMQRTPTSPNLSVYLVLLEYLLSLKHGEHCYTSN